VYWLSYGGGVNSTALAILLCEGALPELTPWETIFADTGDEKDETYAYIEHQFRPYLARHGQTLHVCRDRESVLERWERLGVVGSRVHRTCTWHAKIYPIVEHIRRHGGLWDVQLIGIDAGEAHRARNRPLRTDDPFAKRYPLIEAGINRKGCAAIIRAAGLCVPAKSGCWHCPFMRKRETLDLAKNHPDRMLRIVELEEASMEIRPVEPGKVRAQWAERPAREWLMLAKAEQEQGRLPIDLGSDPDDSACGCYDG
jgi:3'-phosphoadenosine 5'-phosphosulfate sulfotransferase (PAPS reductase)/FAD synthetase